MTAQLFSTAFVLFLTSSASLFAQQTDTVPPADQSFWQTLVMIGIAFLFFYLILWRPEQKRRKTMEQQREAMKKGDRVVAMGIIGTIAKVDEKTVIVRMVDGAKIEFYKAAITDVLPMDSEEPQEPSTNGS